jgi:hypothetical protein
MAAESQFQAPTGDDEPASKAEQFLDHRLDPPSFCRMPDGSMLAEEPDLANKTQDVVGKGAHGHDQCIGGELAAWQPRSRSRSALSSP